MRLLRAATLAYRARTHLVRCASTVSPSAPPVSPSTPALPTYDPEEDPQLAGLNYPKLPSTSRQYRSPYGWWDTQERIQFGEPVPENDDTQSMWAPDVHAVKPSSAVLQLAIALSCVGLFGAGVYAVTPDPPALPRAYPYDGLVKELSGTDDATYAARTTSENVVEQDE